MCVGEFTGKEATFQGNKKHRYNFYVEAIDSVRNAEQKQPKSELTVSVQEYHKNIKGDSKVFVNPNPFYNSIDLIINDDNPSTLCIQISDLLGKIVYSTEKKHNGGIATYKLKDLDMNDGVYILTVYKGNKKKLGSVKILKGL